MNRRRVLVLATTFPRWVNDSEPPFVWELTRRLAKRGFDCSVLVPHAPGALCHEEWEGVHIRRFRYAPLGFERVCYGGGALPNLRASWKARFALPSLLAYQRRAIHRWMAEEPFDLVHAHWIIPQGFWATNPCHKRHVPLLLTAHAGDVFGVRGPVRAAARRALIGASGVTANSVATAAAVQRILESASPRIIPMGVDLGEFQVSTGEGPRRLAGDPAILGLGRFAEKKGFHVLIEALPLIRRTLPDAQLHLAGFGPWEDRLKSLVQSMGLSDCVHFLGSIPHAEVPRLMASADLFVQPSLPASGGDQEGLGVTLLESMAAGIPVVASRSGGIVDVIEDGVHGVLVEPGQPESLARGVVAAWNNADRNGMTQRARDRVSELFDWESVADRFAGVYSELMEPRETAGA